MPLRWQRQWSGEFRSRGHANFMAKLDAEVESLCSSVSSERDNSGNSPKSSAVDFKFPADNKFCAEQTEDDGLLQRPSISTTVDLRLLTDTNELYRKLIEDTECLQLLRDYTASALAIENLLFLLEVDELRRNGSMQLSTISEADGSSAKQHSLEPVQQKCVHLIEKYIIPPSPYIINIDSLLRQSLIHLRERLLQELSFEDFSGVDEQSPKSDLAEDEPMELQQLLSIFDDAYHEILEMYAESVVRPFIASATFQDFQRRRTGDKDGNNSSQSRNSQNSRPPPSPRTAISRALYTLTRRGSTEFIRVPML